MKRDSIEKRGKLLKKHTQKRSMHELWVVSSALWLFTNANDRAVPVAWVNESSPFCFQCSSLTLTDDSLRNPFSLNTSSFEPGFLLVLLFQTLPLTMDRGSVFGQRFFFLKWMQKKNSMIKPSKRVAYGARMVVLWQPFCVCVCVFF